MEIKSSEKTITAKRAKRCVSISINEIPVSVHAKMKAYMNKIRYERKKEYTIKQAYREFLIEKTK